MKQKILIGAGIHSDLEALYHRISAFLNPQNEYFFTFLCVDEGVGNELLEAVAYGNKSAHSLNLLKKVEFELKVEGLTVSGNVNVEAFKSELNDSSLAGLSGVADLFIIDSSSYMNQSDWHELIALVHKVNCPVLVLPRNATVNRLIMVHEPEHHSLHIVKDFLKIFKPDLTELPLSVLFNFPEDEGQTENEKFFVDYLKMAFPNIGMQLMVDEPINEFFNELNADTDRALILTGANLGEEILACPKTIADCTAKSSPLFIYKK
ncbi:hypothetical protein EV198_2516 [Roseivirga ehrenbergii]|uniref:UspA domain-containing protein n=1 Tax=Roseivirga ehrenbergii (strain DSM 102268 / JCM 13514 / KCTC 12282 / NCIMB 14502 / KMM 6017) TaxID=279360 RepID=A0A150XTA4_ROSEK|nr:hypothetical protein [Roseivirga ehrenbergii]KYG81914.1 hypothetical protein MB14_00530 [Roseivirga ehrenbergii]TCL01728.1 hypothetical protein EV198_2516 [Roseivirga ehrenbergii]